MLSKGDLVYTFYLELRQHHFVMTTTYRLYHNGSTTTAMGSTNGQGKKEYV